MDEIKLKADSQNLEEVLSVINNCLNKYNVNIKNRLQLELAIEEIFINISKYAFKVSGDVLIRYEINNNPFKIIVIFCDEGIPFNPLSYEPEDTKLNIEDKKIGGLGISLIKKNVDDITYEYKNGFNILTVEKLL